MRCATAVAPTNHDCAIPGVRVFGIEGAGQFETAGDVVGVDVCFEYMGDAHPVFGRQFQHTVKIAVRDDDCTDVASADQVGSYGRRGRRLR